MLDESSEPLDQRGNGVSGGQDHKLRKVYPWAQSSINLSQPLGTHLQVHDVGSASATGQPVTMLLQLRQNWQLRPEIPTVECLLSRHKASTVLISNSFMKDIQIIQSGLSTNSEWPSVICFYEVTISH